ncbi:hypothetical protein V8D89_013008 [Ganoderma adspersum]
MLTSAAWANPHQLHPWFRMPSQKRKDLSDDDDLDVPRPAYHEPRHSLSPPPRSPKRRRCDVLENGMAQLTLEGLSYVAPSMHRGPVGDVGFYASTSSNYVASTTQIPRPSPFASTSSPPFADGPPSPYVTHIPVKPATSVILPRSVEEPASPEPSVTGNSDVADVPMKGPSWYEIEKDRTSDSFAPAHAPSLPASFRTPVLAPVTNAGRLSPSSRRPLVRRSPRTSVVDAPHNDTGIVITELEDSDAEDEETGAVADSPAPFKISSAFLDRLPKPHSLGPLGPDPSLANALVLYRPVVVRDEAEAEVRRREAERERETGKEKQREVLEGVVEEPQPMGEEEPMEEDTLPCTPMVESVEPGDEPMDIEML